MSIFSLPPSYRTYISNNCSNLAFFFEEERIYDNPFIGSLFVNDLDYLKFCCNFDYYISRIPTFGNPRTDSLWAIQNKNPWYLHSEIKIPYPVMYLDDIEIHWIHQKDEVRVIEKYWKRLQRFFESRIVPIFLFSDSDLCNDHNEIENKQAFQNLLSEYKRIPTSIYLTKEKKKVEDTNRVVYIERWNSIKESRNESHILNLQNIGDRLEDYKKIVKEIFN